MVPAVRIQARNTLLLRYLLRRPVGCAAAPAALNLARVAYAAVHTIIIFFIFT